MASEANFGQEKKGGEIYLEISDNLRDLITLNKYEVEAAKNPDSEIRLRVNIRGSSNTIRKADQPTLFDQYKRSAEADAGLQSGCGLELTLVKGIAEAHLSP